MWLTRDRSHVFDELGEAMNPGRARELVEVDMMGWQCKLGMWHEATILSALGKLSTPGKMGALGQSRTMEGVAPEDIE